jgi:hypothetical protein
MTPFEMADDGAPIRDADATAPAEMPGQQMVDVGPQDLVMILLDAPEPPSPEPATAPLF